MIQSRSNADSSRRGDPGDQRQWPRPLLENKMNTTRLSFPVHAFRNLETPFEKKYKDYFAIAEIKNLPDLKGWRKINVRDAKLSGSVPKAIRESVLDKTDLFVFMNRGLVISVEKIEFDNKNSSVTISLSDASLHGLLDGGHTFDILMEERQNLEGKQYVKVEFLEGFAAADITDLVDARNTSNQVRDQSLMNLQGDFQKLKDSLKGTRYADLIAYKEYETDLAGNPKPIDVREVIAILTVFDRDNFNSRTHPINAYRSKAACLQHFKEHKASYDKLYPRAQDILELFDGILLALPDLYNQQGGKFGRLTGVAVHEGKRKQHLYFSGKDTAYSVPEGFVYPMLGAFRALLEEKGGHYVWGKKMDPTKVLQSELGKQLAQTIGDYALEHRNPSKTGKSIPVWQSCYSLGEIAYLKA